MKGKLWLSSYQNVDARKGEIFSPDLLTLRSHVKLTGGNKEQNDTRASDKHFVTRE